MHVAAGRVTSKQQHQNIYRLWQL